MRRCAVLGLLLGSLALTSAPRAEAFTPLINAIPSSGTAGTAVNIIGADFTAGVPVEIHAGTKTGTLLGTGTATGAGIFGIMITIPSTAPLGPYTIYACGSCASEFFDAATTVFTVTVELPPVTTTTRPPIGDSGGEETVTTVPANICEIPDNAIVVDFDAWSLALGDSESPDGELQAALLAARHPLYLRQWSDYEIRFDPPDADHPNVLHAPRTDSIAFVTDDAAGGLGTTSPPNVLRLVGDNHWTVQAGSGRLQSTLDAFGFIVGVGAFPDGFRVLDGQDAVQPRDGWDHFDTPTEVVVELRVGTMPLEYIDGRLVQQGAWDTVTVTLGPGPQPVRTCVIAVNTLGDLDPMTVYTIDIVAHTPDGAPLDIALDI
ncbi:MAG TPA: hypothetical protein PLV13_12630, partial [Ilumatobacteraceae bacterium]|nr:hypothetical protein [Ilumatobacteraceae bacterium]